MKLTKMENSCLGSILFPFVFQHANLSQPTVYFPDKCANCRVYVLIALSIFRTGVYEKYIWVPLLVFYLSLEADHA